MKWAVLGRNIFEFRYRWLSQYMAAHGIPNTLTFVECGPEEFEPTLERSLKEFDQLRIDSPLREMVVAKFTLQSKVTSDLGAADCVIRRQGEWWPEAGLYYAFTKLFSRFGSALELSADMLVVGSGASARLAVGAGLRAGFSSVKLSSKFDDEGIHLISELKKSYFGVNFQFVPQDRLVLLPGTNSLLVNTTPFSEANDLLQELYYLNFLKPDGMIWDLVIEPETTPLIREGEQIGIRCVRGIEVAALTDARWLEWVSGLTAPDLEVLEFYKKSDLRPVTKNGTPE